CAKRGVRERGDVIRIVEYQNIRLVLFDDKEIGVGIEERVLAGAVRHPRRREGVIPGLVEAQKQVAVAIEIGILDESDLVLANSPRDFEGEIIQRFEVDI